MECLCWGEDSNLQALRHQFLRLARILPNCLRALRASTVRYPVVQSAIVLNILVGRARFELAPLSRLAPKASASTSFATYP